MYELGTKESNVMCGVPTRQTLRQRLEERRKAAVEHLADINQALEFLDKNPNFEAFHNLIGKAGF